MPKEKVEIKKDLPLTYQQAADRLCDYASFSGSDSDMSQLAAYFSGWIKIDEDLRSEKEMDVVILLESLLSAINYLQGGGSSTNDNPKIRLANRHAQLFFSDPEDWKEETCCLYLMTLSSVLGSEFKNYADRELTPTIMEIFGIVPVDHK